MIDTYKNLCALFYEADKPHAPKEALDFYMHHAIKAGGKILEPMCGTGNFLIPMAKAGLDVRGFDASEDMIRLLYQKTNQAGLAAICEIEEFRWQKDVYNLVFIPSGSLGLVIHDESLQRFFTHIFLSLNRGGKCIFDFETISSAKAIVTGTWQGKVCHLSQEKRIVLSTLSFPLIDGIGSTLCRYELTEKNALIKTEFETLTIRLFEPNELICLLKKVGFLKIVFEKAYKSGQPANSGSDELIVCIAEKI